jgi:hypothetical protein
MSTNNTTRGAAHRSDELKERFEGLLADNTAMPLQARSDLAEVMAIFAETQFAARLAVPELSNDGIVKVLASFGIDATESKYGFPELQVATNVPGIRNVIEIYLAAGPLVPPAARDVFAERRRQVDQEGWTSTHDDKYRHCELARAAATYALCSDPEQLMLCGARTWPWRLDWWKRSTYRRDLIKSGALILAEIERLDRATVQHADKPAGYQESRL